MVLHLLPKKSWNVYNNDNIDRVRRDEAEAQAAEEAEERRMQEADAERRIAILRGEQPALLPTPVEEDSSANRRRRREPDCGLRDRKRRRLKGEDDTDRDIRHAREDAQAGLQASKRMIRSAVANADAPLQDHAGHINLVPVPDERATRKAEKNAEAEGEKGQKQKRKRKRKREEDKASIKFANAAGYNAGMAKPWYASSITTASREVAESSTAMVLADVREKDVWGNEDLRRRERERNRMLSSDPFAAMQSAQRQLKQSERDREVWKREREMEAEELQRAEAKERRRRREKRCRRRDEDDGSLEGSGMSHDSRPLEVR